MPNKNITKLVGGGNSFNQYKENFQKICGEISKKHVTKNNLYRISLTYIRTEKKINRNSKCPCGSGFKYKNCCMDS